MTIDKGVKFSFSTPAQREVIERLKAECPPVVIDPGDRVIPRRDAMFGPCRRRLAQRLLDLIVPPWAVYAGRHRPPAGHHGWEVTPR